MAIFILFGSSLLLLLRRCCRVVFVAVERVGVLLVVIEGGAAAAGEGERVRVKNRRGAGCEGDAAADDDASAADDFLVLRDLLRPRRPAGVSGRLFVISINWYYSQIIIYWKYSM